MRRSCAVLGFLFLLVGLAACYSCSNDSDHGDSGTNSDTDTDTDGDTDTDTDSDTDSDADTDTDSDTDTDTDTDTGEALPIGCDLIEPANENMFGWTGREALDSDYLVWRWQDTSTSLDKFYLMKRQLSTGIQEQILAREYPDSIDTPVIYGDDIYFTRETTGGGSYPNTREVFSIGLVESTETQLTNNSVADAYPIGGENNVIYMYADDSILSYGLSEYILELGNEDRIIENQVIQLKAFDGTKWLALVYCSGGASDCHLYKYDFENTVTGVQLVLNEELDEFNMSFERTSHTLVGGFTISGVTDSYDLLTWNMETNEYSILVGAPYDQGLPDADGHIVGYVDSQASGHGWWSTNEAEVKIIDLDTHTVRTVLPLDVYYGLGIWSHYLAVNNVGTWGDSIILCDLEVMGLVGTDGHVCPASGCTAADAGVDGGK